jgi:hypothetical protein
MKQNLAVALIVVAGVFMLSASSVLADHLAGVLCNGDFTNDGDVDGTDLSTFLIHYGRGTYHDPCPPAGDCDLPAPVPRTGQTLCYDYITHAQIPCQDAAHGETLQDGYLQRGVELPNPRYTDNADGTVTDNSTGLMWLKDANCIKTHYPELDNSGDGVAEGAVTWSRALDLVYGWNYLPLCTAGYNDWRLPNINELNSLVDRSVASAMPPGNPFINLPTSTGDAEDLNLCVYFWSSTTYPAKPPQMAQYYSVWVATFQERLVNLGYCEDDTRSHTQLIMKYDYAFVWPVRGNVPLTTTTSSIYVGTDCIPGECGTGECCCHFDGGLCNSKSCVPLGACDPGLFCAQANCLD